MYKYKIRTQLSSIVLSNHNRARNSVVFLKIRARNSTQIICIFARNSKTPTILYKAYYILLKIKYIITYRY